MSFPIGIKDYLIKTINLSLIANNNETAKNNFKKNLLSLEKQIDKIFNIMSVNDNDLSFLPTLCLLRYPPANLSDYGKDINCCIKRAENNLHKLVLIRYITNHYINQIYNKTYGDYLSQNQQSGGYKKIKKLSHKTKRTSRKK